MLSVKGPMNSNSATVSAEFFESISKMSIGRSTLNSGTNNFTTVEFHHTHLI